MGYSKEKLKEIARPYFEDEKVKSLFVTEDNQVFYENAANYAEAHSKIKDVKLHQFTSKDFEDIKIDDKNEPEPVSIGEESLRDKAKKLGIKVPGRASDTKIQELIDEKLNENAGE